MQDPAAPPDTGIIGEAGALGRQSHSRLGGAGVGTLQDELGPAVEIQHGG